MIKTSTEFVNGGKHRIHTGIETFYPILPEYTSAS